LANLYSGSGLNRRQCSSAVPQPFRRANDEASRNFGPPKNVGIFDFSKRLPFNRPDPPDCFGIVHCLAA
jgi:hypothetical protein